MSHKYSRMLASNQNTASKHKSMTTLIHTQKPRVALRRNVSEHAPTEKKS